MDLKIGLYGAMVSIFPLSILISYTFLVIYLLGLCKKSEDFISLNGVLDFIYVTCEILAVYLAIITFPTHEAKVS